MRSLRGRDLLVATGNRGKMAEFSAILGPHGVRLLSLAEFGLGEPDETASDFVGNARIKARSAFNGSGLPSLADDSGIIVEGLGGCPGIFTADWAECSTGRDFGVAMRKTWDVLDSMGRRFPRRATFRATLVLAWPEGGEDVFVGEAPGEIVWPMRGESGHGYDPIFLPDGHDQTFGEMDDKMKNLVSHRAVALQKLVAACFT